MELSSFGLKFASTSTIKSRALAEFIAEWTATPDEEIQETTLPGKEMGSEWIMYFDELSHSKVLVLAYYSSHPPESASST